MTTQATETKGLTHTGHIVKQGNPSTKSRYNPSGYVLFSSKTDSLAKTFRSREDAVKYAAKENISLVTVVRQTTRNRGKAA